MSPDEKESMDDWFNEGLDQVVSKTTQTPPRTLFPTVPNGTGVPPKPEPPAQKPKSLASLGISQGGIVRNATTVVRTQLQNPVANPKGVGTRTSTILDRADLPPEFGVPTLMQTMDVDLGERAKAKAEQVLPTQPAEEAPSAAAPKFVTMRSTLAELIEVARLNGGIYKSGTNQFSVEILLKEPF
jgi:hypothetical protein